jgi:hypothetical protein
VAAAEDVEENVGEDDSFSLTVEGISPQGTLLLGIKKTVQDTAEEPLPTEVEPNAEDCTATDTSGTSKEGPPIEEVEGRDVPPLNIVIMIAGTRGDVQPFLALGLKLQVRVLLS